MASSTSKGKSTDLSSEWSEWLYDEDYRSYFQWRYDQDGVAERYYAEPDNAQQDEITPRTPDPQPAYNPTTPLSYDTGGQNYTTSPGGDSENTLDYNRNYSQVLDHTNPSSSHSGYGYRTTPLDTITQGVERIAVSERASTSTLIQNAKKIRATKKPSEVERLDERYRTIPEKSQKTFWKPGRVFMMLWTEPAANSGKVPSTGGTRNGSHISTTWLNENAYSEIRRFVVMRVNHGNNICCPIQTYSGQATLKPNLPDPQEHAIIYTSENVPAEHSIVEDGQVRYEELSKDPIKVNGVNGEQGILDPLSRLNYNKIYTVENYVRVLNIGMVDKDSMPTLDTNSIVKSAGPKAPKYKDNHKKSGGSSYKTSGKYR